MAEEPHTHTVVSMSVIEYTVQVRLPPSPSEPTLVVRPVPDLACFGCLFFHFLCAASCGRDNFVRCVRTIQNNPH
jgi:hypothetical protein